MGPEETSKKLGIIAGGGLLPGILRESWEGTGGKVFVLAFEGFTDPITVNGAEHAWIGLAKIGAAISTLKQEQCDFVVLAGSVQRPSWSSLAPDLRGIALIRRLSSAKGDDKILRIIISELESEGFQVLGADDIVRDLLAPPGALGQNSPKALDWQDIQIAAAAALSIGEQDVGQAAIARFGKVVEVEGIDGTDVLIDKCKTQEIPSGVLVKRLKPKQDRRIDLPTIGLQTVKKVADANLNGIVVEAMSTLVIEKSKVVAAADRLGIFIYGATKDEWV